MSLVSLSAASHGGGSNRYGQTGILTGLEIETCFPDEAIFHPTNWVRNKQQRVTYSYFRNEIFACADWKERRIDMKNSLKNILQLSLSRT